MKLYNRHDGTGMPTPIDEAATPHTTIYVSSGAYWEGGMFPTDRQAVTINLIGPPEEIDQIMARFGIEATGDAS